MRASGLLNLRKHHTGPGGGIPPITSPPPPQPQPYLPRFRDPRGARGLATAHGPEADESKRGISPSRHQGLHTQSLSNLRAG